MVNLIKMPAIEERRVTQSGSSLIMTLPKAWTEENNLKNGDIILVRANGHIEIRIKNNENVEKMNAEVLSVRNQLNHITRSDEDTTGEKRQALVSQTNENSRG